MFASARPHLARKVESYHLALRHCLASKKGHNKRNSEPEPFLMTAPESATQTLEAPQDEAPASRHAYALTQPARQTVPFVFSSPHSGRHYPADFVAASVLDETTLRASEDIYVDQLFSAVPSLGAPLLQAEYARAYVDINREAWELDPEMFSDALPDYVNTRSGRVTAGLGTIAKVVASDTNIYRDQLAFADALWRVEHVYKPYHACLEKLVNTTTEQFGHSVMVDCHSMPSIGTSFGNTPLRSKGATADFILGDRYGKSCAPEIISIAEDVLRGFNYRVVRNTPYSGGYNTRQYGQRDKNQHALQIEINRALYVNETTLEKTAHFDTLQHQLTKMCEALTTVSPKYL